MIQWDNEYPVDRRLCYVHTHSRNQGHRFPAMENRARDAQWSWAQSFCRSVLFEIMTWSEPRQNLREAPHHWLLYTVIYSQLLEKAFASHFDHTTPSLLSQGPGTHCTRAGLARQQSWGRGSPLPKRNDVASPLLCSDSSPPMPIESCFLPSLSSATSQALPGANLALYDGLLYNSVAPGICQSGCKQQRSFYHCYSEAVNTDVVFCN